jgi:hypothetical protein
VTRITATLDENLCTLMITCRSFLQRMRNVSDERRRESQNSYFMSNTFFYDHAVYEMWQNMAVREVTDDDIIRLRKDEVFNAG